MLNDNIPEHIRGNYFERISHDDNFMKSVYRILPEDKDIILNPPTFQELKDKFGSALGEDIEEGLIFRCYRAILRNANKQNDI